jgi:hypothetical protein
MWIPEGLPDRFNPFIERSPPVTARDFELESATYRYGKYITGEKRLGL